MFSSIEFLRLMTFLTFIGLVSAQVSWQETAFDLLRNGSENEARQLLLQVVDRDPVNEEAHAMLGQIAFDQKQYKKATTHFAKSPTVLKENPLLLVNYAECLLETKAHIEALRSLEGLPEQDDVAQFESGVLLARFDDHQSAERYFQLAKDYPNPYPVAYNLGLTQYHLGKFKQCVATLEEIRTRFKTNDILNLLGLAYIELGELEKAVEILEEGMRNNPLDERNYVAVAKLATESQQVNLGLRILDRGLRYLPLSYPLLMQHGYLNLLQSRHTDAERKYRKALSLQPDSSDTRLSLAFVLIADQRHSEAAVMVREVINLDSSNALAHYLTGELLIIGGVQPGTAAEKEAVNHLEKAVSLQPHFAVAHLSLGKLYLKRKELVPAIRELEMAIQYDPSEKAAHYQLAVAYRQNGEKEKSLEALNKVQQMNVDERNLGRNRLLYKKLRTVGEGVLFSPRGKQK